MNKNIVILSIILLSSVLLPTGCNRNQSPYSRTQPAPSQYPEQYYDSNYEVWVGPGLYYGTYFSRERHYRDWRRRHYHSRSGYGHPRYRRYHGGRGFHRGSGHSRAGRGRHGGRGRR